MIGLSETDSVSQQERLRFEALAILLEARHDNVEARMRHCREVASILRQMIGRIENLESRICGTSSEAQRVRQ